MRGYLNREELNIEKLINIPSLNKTKIYKTGDKVLWLPDGNIHFLGRYDNQVKIRGLRIETGEIEFCLLKHPGINNVKVLCCGQTDIDKYLSAYVIAEQDISKQELITFLSERLPDYMIPLVYYKLDEIPVTQNGKTDRRALLDTDKTRIIT